MLSGKGFKKVFNISGGIVAWDAKTAIGSPELGMDIFTGKEGPLEILKVAYSLEQGLREFYLTMEEKVQSVKVKDLFSKLAEIEVKHQMSVYLTYTDLSPEEINKTDFEKMVEVQAVEGGLSTEEYLEFFKPDTSSEIDVISLAMSIEAQALDLYQRVALKIENPESKDILNKIANEEKAHLASLGRLLDDL
jgi:rubrerythrin